MKEFKDGGRGASNEGGGSTLPEKFGYTWSGNAVAWSDSAKISEEKAQSCDIADFSNRACECSADELNTLLEAKERRLEAQRLTAQAGKGGS